MTIEYPEIGVCGLSCRLCPRYHTDTKSRCQGCKSEGRMTVGCPFITCAVKQKEIEFCGDCNGCKTCERWAGHRETGKRVDSFISYQKLEENIAFIRQNGLTDFDRVQKMREKLLREMLREYNEGRSKRYYCVASTVLKIDELTEALARARKDSRGMAIKEKANVLHSVLDEAAARRGYCLALRK
jgi:hypothetical protein